MENTEGNKTSRKVWSILLSVFTLGYFIPTSISIYRYRKNTLAIFCLNFFLGWTLIGWVVALVWAVAEEK